MRDAPNLRRYEASLEAVPLPNKPPTVGRNACSVTLGISSWEDLSLGSYKLSFQGSCNKSLTGRSNFSHLLLAESAIIGLPTFKPARSYSRSDG